MKKLTAIVLALPLVLTLGCEKLSEMEKAAKDLEKAGKALEKAAKKMEKEVGAAGKAVQKEGDAVADGESVDEAAKRMKGALEHLQGALAGQDDGTTTEPVPFRDLKKMLPEKAGVLTRTKAKGETSKGMGVKVSMAEGRYEGAGGSAKLKIVDMGTMRGAAKMAMTAWTLAEIDRESDDGYEKTTKHAGYNGFEKFRNNGKRGELKLVVAERFMIDATGRGVDMKALKALVDAVGLDDLAKKKNFGVTAKPAEKK